MIDGNTVSDMEMVDENVLSAIRTHLLLFCVK